jgi:uncharacterized protein (TIGR00255 family)
MTGFAREDTETQFGTLTCELRSVNHRYLDVHFRLPEELRAKEIELRQRIGNTLKRGKVDCSLHLRRSGSTAAALEINADLVRQIGARIDEIVTLVPAAQAVDPVDILRWPGVIEEPAIDTDPLFDAATVLLEHTLGALGQMRSSEGQRIASMLETRCKDILLLAAGVRERMPQVLDAVRAKQQERIDKLDIDADPARLETELALVAQKLDVDEELDRLESHISEIRTALQNKDAVGRRLDFLMQELNREANTLGSKSADAETTKAAVELKVLIEQMREQIQNVE